MIYLVIINKLKVFEGSKKECKEYIALNGGILYKNYYGRLVKL
jgi:hypothetical protein